MKRRRFRCRLQARSNPLLGLITLISQDRPIVIRIQARRLRYFGHVVRMGQHRLPNIALYSRVEGNRPKGRPRKRWLDNVTDDCYHRGWSIVEATHL